MDIIVRGEPNEIDFVRRLCRDKVRRGVIAILPATSPACDDVVKLRNERDETTQENERLKERIRELEEQITSVPETTENVPVSTNSAIEPNTTNSDAMDNKYVDPDEFQEVDMDTDDKTLTDNDSKDVPANVAKETAPAKKTSKRSKKSE